MTAPVLRVLRSGALHPHRNMGLDEALLLGAAEPTLRLYRWQPAGLSLGYFQRAAEFAEVPGDHVLVRRITGGGAIYHADEITFALAVDADVLPTAIGDSYDLIHEAVRIALAGVGVRVQRRGGGAGAGGGRGVAKWCFADPVCEDLMTRAGRKIVGSAQRRVRRPRERVLHHGSLVLRAPDAAPCGSVADEVDPRAIESELEDRLVTGLAASLGLDHAEGKLTEAESAAADTLAREKYASDAFTRRR